MARQSEQAMADAVRERPVMLNAYQCAFLLDYLRWAIDGHEQLDPYDLTDRQRGMALAIEQAIHKAATDA
jgi:hypothetical protein